MIIIYKTTNTVNGKIYIGQHQQQDGVFDGYLGSGFLLKRAVTKYGAGAFVRETLAVCDSKDIANITEMALISQYNSCNPDIGYNITEGGQGGDTITNHPNRDNIIAKCTTIKKQRVAQGVWVNPLDCPATLDKLKLIRQHNSKYHPEYWDAVRGPRTAEQRERRWKTFADNRAAGKHQAPAITSTNISTAQRNRFSQRPETHGMLGNNHSIESRQKISATRKERIANGTIVCTTPNVDAISGVNNYQFVGWYITPWGRFASIKDVCQAVGALITDQTTVRKIFSNIESVASTRSARVCGGKKGNTWAQLGFSFEPK